MVVLLLAMGLLIICFGERRKLFGTEDIGPTSTPFCFCLTLQNQIGYKTNSNATKTEVIPVDNPELKKWNLQLPPDEVK